MMKYIALLLLAGILFGGCKKEDEPPLLRIPVTNLVFEVSPAIQPPFTYYIPINEVKINAQALLDVRGIDTANIQSIRPLRASIAVVFGDSNLDFLRDGTVEVRLCARGDNDENCGREAFYVQPVPFDPGSLIDLNASNVNDLSELVLADEINVQVILENFLSIPPGTFQIVLTMEFGVY